MADDVILPGTGSTIATDDDGTRQHQWVKLEWGPADTFNKVDTASGKPLPVQLRSPTGTDMTGTAGTASAAVVTVQGVASMTPVLTQPASATAPVSTMNSASANSGVNSALAAVFDDTTPTAITENSFGFLRMSANRNLYGTIRDAAGNERGTNVDASNRLTTAPTLVSGSVASGAYASGAYASGALASGAMVDVTNLSTPITPATATATKGTLIGAQYNSTQATFTNGQQGSVQITSRGALMVGTGADTFNVTVNAALPAGTALVGKVGIDQTTPGTTDSVTVKTQGYGASVTLTRTADTNVYAANDVLGSATGSTAALTFTSMGPSAGRIMITSASLEIDASAVISGETSYRLYLYNVTPPSALGDNTAWDLPSGDRTSFLGYVDLGTPVDLGSTLYVETNGINKQLLLSGTSLFAYLVTITGYTPTSARVHKITLHAVAV